MLRQPDGSKKVLRTDQLEPKINLQKNTFSEEVFRKT